MCAITNNFVFVETMYYYKEAGIGKLRYHRWPRGLLEVRRSPGMHLPKGHGFCMGLSLVLSDLSTTGGLQSQAIMVPILT